MLLPDRLDYEKSAESDWSPDVFCTVSGCGWTFAAAWGDLGDDGDVDWDAEHPDHLPVRA